MDAYKEEDSRVNADYLAGAIAEALCPPTLRDRFAMAALTGLVSRTPRYDYGTAAQSAYRYADAMMKEREFNA